VTTKDSAKNKKSPTKGSAKNKKPPTKRKAASPSNKDRRLVKKVDYSGLDVDDEDSGYEDDEEGDEDDGDY